MQILPKAYAFSGDFKTNSWELVLKICGKSINACQKTAIYFCGSPYLALSLKARNDAVVRGIYAWLLIAALLLTRMA